MLAMIETQTHKNYFLLYLLLFFSYWAVSVYIEFARIYAGVDSNILTIIRALLNLSVWVLPVYIFLKYIYKDPKPFEYLKMDKNIAVFIFLGGLFELTTLSLKWFPLITGSPDIFWTNLNSITLNTWINNIFLIGFIEEIAFRGFILQKLQEKYGFLIANLGASTLFLAIHIPSQLRGWTTSAVFIQSSLYIFVISLLLGYLFKITKNLWFNISVHSTHDFLLILMGMY